MKNPVTVNSLLRVITIGSALATFYPATLPAQSAGLAVPPALEVPAGNEAYFKASASGTQNYLCLPSGWTFIGPQATLFVTIPWVKGSIRQQVATHFLSPNPAEFGTARATWESSFDTSMVWAKTIASSTDFADPSAVPWLLLEAQGTQDGPTGGSALSKTTYIQRVNTTGGMMPTTACTTGVRAFVPYTAEYVFYRKASH